MMDLILVMIPMHIQKSPTLKIPFQETRESGSPGEDFRIGAHSVKFWYFGISRIDISSISVYNDTILTGTVSFKNGFINNMVPVTGKTKSDLMDDLYVHLLKVDPNPFDTITHSLTVIRDQNGNFAQEMVDASGRKIATRSDPTSNSDDEIIAEYEYNVLGQLIAEKAPKHAPESGSPVQLIENSEGSIPPLRALSHSTGVRSLTSASSGRIAILINMSLRYSSGLHLYFGALFGVENNTGNSHDVESSPYIALRGIEPRFDG